MKDLAHSAAPNTQRGADGADLDRSPLVVAPSKLEIAWGCLWGAVTDDPAVHAARRHLSDVIGSDGRIRGARWVVDHFPPITDDEVRRIEI